MGCGRYTLVVGQRVAWRQFDAQAVAANMLTTEDVHPGDRMTKQTNLTRANISEAVHNKVGLSRAESSNLVESILRHMCGALSDGSNVKITGFGTFILRDKGERIGRNPKTGVEVPITPRRVLTFRASHIMRERISPN